MRLIFDEMLEKAGRWARLFGIDSTIAKGPDDKIIAIAKKSKRILITRDKQLAQRCQKAKIRCFLINATDVGNQLFQIETTAGKRLFFFPEKTRCPICNSTLSIKKKKSVSLYVPHSVYIHHRKFWFCKKCKKVYWRGGHWKNILKIKRKLSQLIKKVKK